MAKYHQHGNKSRFTITIDSELHKKIIELADGRRGGASGVIEDCVRGYLDYLEKEPEPLISKSPKVDEVQKIIDELLSPEMVLEAMKIARSKSDVADELLEEHKQSKPARKRKTAVRAG